MNLLIMAVTESLGWVLNVAAIFFSTKHFSNFHRHRACLLQDRRAAASIRPGLIEQNLPRRCKGCRNQICCDDTDSNKSKSNQI